MQKMVIELQLLPPISTFINALQHGTLLIEKHENYQKKTFRNRYNILTANGSITLSVPLSKGKNSKCPITQVLISYDENWVKNHITSITSAYANAPYFDFYSSEIFAILKSKEKHLWTLSDMFLKYVKTQFLPSLNIEYTTKYYNSHPNDFRSKFLPSKTTELNINNYYPQVFEEKFDFIPGLSILDLIFNCGNESEYYLKQHLQKELINNDE